jgi:hypothetical protein
VSATPPPSRGFRFTDETLSGPPAMNPRRLDDGARAFYPGPTSPPTFAELAAAVAAMNPGLYLNASGQPNSKAINAAMASAEGQQALARERERNLRVNAPP